MLRIGYGISPTERQRLGAARPGGVDEARLRYYHTWGTITLSCAKAGARLSFEAPVLDFALGMNWLSRELESNPNGAYEFTDSDAELTLTRAGDRVRISANFAQWSCECDCAAFCATARDLLRAVLDDLSRDLPELSDNPVVLEARAKYLAG